MFSNGNHHNGNETDAAMRARYATMEAEANALSAIPHPFHGLASLSRDLATAADRLPDSELIRMAGCLRTMADEVMAVIDRRLGGRPAPRLVVDNTRR